MPERNTFDDHAYAVPGAQNTFWIPAAAALRKIEPTLPASCTPSSTMQVLRDAFRQRRFDLLDEQQHADAMHDARKLAEERIRQRVHALVLDARDDRPRFLVLQCAFGDDARFRLAGGIQIGGREMQTFQQRVAASALLRRRTGERLQALVERIVPRGDGISRLGCQKARASGSVIGRCGTPRSRRARSSGSTMPKRACASRTGANDRR